MHNLSLILLLLGSSLAFGADDAATLCASLERHLQSLTSLEIRYEASISGEDGDSMQGRIVWTKPDRFLHETANWTLCVTGDEQWRYLKDQNTLIRERTPEQGVRLPENILFHATSEFKPVALEQNDAGTRTVVLHADAEDAAGEARIEFPKTSDIPHAVQFWPPDAQSIRYRIVSWRENGTVNESDFSPPSVPAENTIDFRSAGGR